MTVRENSAGSLSALSQILCPLMVRAAHKLPLSLESGNVPRRGVCLPAKDGYPNKCNVMQQRHCLKTAAFNAEINYLPNLRHCHC